MTYLILTIIGLSILFYLCETAPMGYEDETGFYYGDKHEQQ
jgi:hypothetical protein